MKTSKKILSVLLSIMMILSTVSCLGMVAFAADSDFTIKSGRLTEYVGPGGDIVIPDGVTSIGSSAFRGTEVTSVVIPEGVKSIGNNAFENCENLESVTFPNSLGSIGNSAFNGCSALMSVDIPDSVKTIGTSAFQMCYALMSVKLPANLTTISKGLFEFCFSIDTIIIPDGVTSIGDYAFEDCQSLKNVTIPDGVTSIGSKAFESCEALESVTIPDSVTSIGSSAFNYCYALTSVTIPDSVTSIRDYAFNNCRSLGSITIPNSVTSIGTNMFYGCNNLTSVTLPASAADNENVNSDMFKYCNIQNIYVPCNCDLNAVKSQLGSLGDKVKQNGHDYVNGTCTVCGEKEPSDFIIDENGVLTGYTGAGGDIVIPDGVTAIGDKAFYWKSKITSVKIPDSVTSIGEQAFYLCSSLKTIEIPNTLTSIGEEAFDACSSLTSVTIPGGVKSIGKWVFSGCSSLANVTIADGVENIGIAAFASCSSLADITIPDSVTNIDSSAFNYCNALVNVTIPDSVTNIGDSAFSFCKGLTEITLSNSITTINSSLFNGCSKLESVTIPDSVTTIGSSAFMSSGIKSIIIPDGVKTISSSAFSNCQKLESVELPDSLEKIDMKSFYGCMALTSVTIPKNVNNIGRDTFANCQKLANVTILGRIDNIDSSAFRECGKLENIYVSCNNNVDNIKAKLSSLNPDLFTQLDHDYVNGTCTVCGFNLDNYKDEILTKLSEFADSKIKEEAMQLDSFLELAAEIEEKISDATTVEEVDEINADALKALDEYVLEEHTVKIGDVTVDQVYKPEKSAKYQIATVTIPEKDGIKDGKWFVYWVDGKGNIVSSYSTYSFFVCEDRTLTPVYVDPDDYQTERAKAILVTDIVRADDNGDGTATLFAEHSASKAAVGNAILQHGVIYTTDAAQKDNLTVDNDNVSKTVAAKTNTSLSGLLKTVIDVNENDTVYAKSYMIDANGNTVYGATKTLSIGKISTSSDSDFEVLGFDNALEQAEEIIVTADEAPVVTETETAPSFMNVLMSILNAVMALVQAIIALF